ncbi:MAG: UvrD-helicase domain-containing protein, partial [Bacteroidota bacterium]
MENRLHIYRSSAGSGKTFTLVKEYLRIVLARPEEYRHVLAITFTNKAAEEMKNRVIEALVDLESGNGSSLRNLLEKELPEGTPITENASKVLRSILHDYPSFAISTIDSFFQRLLRSLAREIHLPLRVEVKLEVDDAVMDVTDRLLKQSDKDPELSAWLQHLMFRKLEEDKGWDIQSDIASIAKELLKERGVSADVMDREALKTLSSKLTEEHDAFEKALRNEARAALEKMQRFGLEASDFASGKNGVAGYLKKAAEARSPKEFSFGSNAAKAARSPEGWLTKEKAKDTSLLDLVRREFHPHLEKMAERMHTGWTGYVSNHHLLKTLFLLGIVNDLTRLFAEYRKENNQILISDTAKLLQEVITGDDTPFIYEKTGNRYKYLLIDEFQDTSESQWMNLLPLVVNSLGSGFMSLVVGDAKQSIYRWRGGDLRLLLEGIEKHLQPFKELISSTPLSTNYRSKKAIVDFNNAIFKRVCDVIATIEGLNDLSTLRLAYGKDVEQLVAEKKGKGGYVEVRFIEQEKKVSPSEKAE